MKTSTKKIIYIGLPLVLAAAFLTWYLLRDKKKNKYVKTEDPAKAKQDPAKESPATPKTGSAVTAGSAGPYPLKNGVYDSPLVSELQRILNGTGAKLVVDGDFGPKTEAALQTYYGKKQIDSAEDFNAFKAKVQSAATTNSNTARSQVIINNYKSATTKQVYTTMATSVMVIMASANNGFAPTGEMISIDKLVAFPRERFQPLAIGPGGYLIAKYQAPLGLATFTILADPEAFAVK